MTERVLIVDDGPVQRRRLGAIRFAPAHDGGRISAAAPKRGIRRSDLHRKLETLGEALLAPRDALSVAVR